MNLRRFAGSYAGRVGAITALGLLGRVAFLGHQPLWRDEAFTAIVVHRSTVPMLDAVRADSAPPLAYLFDHVVVGFWSGPAGLRLVSALAGGAAIPIGAALGRRIGGDRTGLITALLMTIAPAMVLSARDARMYALASTLVLAATLLLWRAVERPSPARWILYGAATTLALYTAYFAALAMAAQLFAVAFVLRPGWRRVLVAGVSAGAAVLLLVPWLVAARAQFTHGSAPFWVPPIGFQSAGGESVQFFVGQPLEAWVPLRPVLLVFQSLAVAAGLVALFTLMQRRQDLGAPGREAARFCVACGAGALVLLLAISIWRPLVDGRYMSVVWGPIFPLLGAGLALIRMRTVMAGALAAMASASISVSAAITHPDTQAAVAALQPRLTSRDVVDTYPTQYLLFLYYGDAGLLARTHVVSSGIDWFWGTAAYPADGIIPAIPTSVIAGRGAVFYVAQPDDPGAPPSLPAGYRAGWAQCWTGVCVTDYAP